MTCFQQDLPLWVQYGWLGIGIVMIVVIFYKVYQSHREKYPK